MAKVTLSSVVIQASGAVGGNVFLKGVTGNIVRARVSPLAVNTPARSQAKSNLASASGAWKSLSPSQQTGWNNYAAEYPVYNVLGKATNISGHSMYTRLNTRLKQIGSVQIEDAPTTNSVGYIGPVVGAYSSAGGGWMGFYNNTGVSGDNSQYYIFATPNLSAGTTPDASKYKYVNSGSNSYSGSYVIYQQSYSAVFPSVAQAATNNIWVSIAAISTITGVTTPPVTMSAYYS
jgi:hypothetical protein